MRWKLVLIVRMSIMIMILQAAIFARAAELTFLQLLPATIALMGTEQ
jgi:hypothetical protein